MMTANTITEIITCLVAAPFFEEIIQRYFTKRAERDNFRNHIVVEVANIPLDKLNKAIQEEYIKYLFARIVKNQVVSSNSSWHNQHRISAFEGEDYPEVEDLLDENELAEFKLDRERYRLIKPAITNILGRTYKKIRQAQIVKVNITCFEMYHFENLTYKQISQQTNISEATVYRAVKNAEVLIRTEINKMIKNKK